jgi:dTDP-4-dehydrorhamnose reductase
VSQEVALAMELLQKEIPISTKQYPTPARLPDYSVLDKQQTESQLGMMFPHWHESLQEMLSQQLESP